MFAPVRSRYALRPGAPLPLLAGAVAVALVFAATPFLIPEVADRYGVSVGTAGAISLAQVGAFALVTFVLPKLTAPTSRLYLTAVAALVAANGAAALLDVFALLVAVRVLAGAATGILTWMAWHDAMTTPRSLSSISAAAPLTTLVGAPILGLLAIAGDRAIYAALALAALPLLALRPHFEGARDRARTVSRSKSNRALLAALFLVTLAGASFFIYAGAAARTALGLGPVATSLGFSLNAGGGLLGARLSGRHRHPGLWLASAGPAAAVTIVFEVPALFFVGLAWWGFAFWMGIPGVMQMLAARSLRRAERAGDAQSAMAVGRTLAPLLGGAFANAEAYGTLAIVAGSGLSLAGLSIAAVQEGRDRLPPTYPIMSEA